MADLDDVVYRLKMLEKSLDSLEQEVRGLRSDLQQELSTFHSGSFAKELIGILKQIRDK
jgi:hypothetical protein